MTSGQRTKACHVAQMVCLLQAEGQTFDALSKKTGLQKRNVERWVKQNRSNLFVENYAPDKRGRDFVRVWRWGPGRQDAARPGRRISDAERMRLLRAERKLFGGAA